MVESESEPIGRTTWTINGVELVQDAMDIILEVEGEAAKEWLEKASIWLQQ